MVFVFDFDVEEFGKEVGFVYVFVLVLEVFCVKLDVEVV